VGPTDTPDGSIPHRRLQRRPTRPARTVGPPRRVLPVAGAALTGSPAGSLVGAPSAARSVFAVIPEFCAMLSALRCVAGCDLLPA